jgi:hypothetical protein
MKVGILSESPVDQAAIRILSEAVLRRQIELIEPRGQPTGCGAVLSAVAVELIRIHYHTDGDGLIIVIDSDDTPVHTSNHLVQPLDGCRVCEIEAKVRQVRRSLNPRSDKTEVQVAIAVPVPAIEAWLRCGTDPHAAEAPYVRLLQQGAKRPDIRRQLKINLYGTDYPRLGRAKEIAIREATRLATDLDRLRTQFPLGFGLFYETLASWR